VKRLEVAFAQAKAQGRAAFIPFLTAGFPDRRRFIATAKALLELSDALEVGLPFSDPLGDGPTIQRASEAALRQGITTPEVFALLATLRQASDKPLVLMTYYNPILCYPSGEAGFVADAKTAGIDGLILPDLPPDEGESLISAARQHGLATIFLVAPTSTEARLRVVTQACRGFVYAVSVTGVTGARAEALGEVPTLIQRTRAVTDLPIAVGFGVASAESARAVAAVADGVVVGSALIHALERGNEVLALARAIATGCHRG
jgi:tryptophan synthase alpha chain